MTFSTLRTLVAFLILSALPAAAQEFRGRVQGVVTDASGGLMPGVVVTLRNTGTGVDAARPTNEQGRFIFDYVDPGTYTLTGEMRGFKKFVQGNIIVQQRGDVTVDLKMETGAVTESITVDASPVALELNTASRDLTIESKMVQNLPVNTRNPWQLVALDPTVVNRGSTIETQPYHHRTADEMDLGGGTKYRNDALIDGTPVIAGDKLAYTPAMDSVTEYTVQQNSVDAEFGHSAGGIVLLTTKSGSNQYHGSAYYYGRNSSLNAITDRAVQRHSDTPYWDAGGTFGMPIKKNKLFVFGSFDKIGNSQASPGTYTLPTALERKGDFSQSVAKDGKLRVIYDPTSTVITGSTSTRQPYVGNVIPANLQDKASRKMMDNLWTATSAGDDATLLNNYKYLNQLDFHYYNYSARVDYNISDKWKAFGRISRFKTDQDQVDFTNGQDPLKLRNVQGSKRNGWNAAGDTVYMINPTTTLNLRGSFFAVEDKRDYPAMAITESDLKAVWSNTWWRDGKSDYLAGRPLIYFPEVVVDSNSYGRFGVQNFWYQQPSGYSAHARLTKYYNKHYLKAGAEVRWKRGSGARFYFGDFFFTPQETGKDYSKADTATGHSWASFLLGAVNTSSSNVRYTVLESANTEMYGFYFQDDYKLTPKLTLNLGLRYEYEGGFWDPQNRLPQRLDLTDPIPGMQAAVDPLIPADVRAKMGESTGVKNYIYNGAFHFSEPGNDRKTSADKYGFMPRAGLAWRIKEKSVIRVGYGRFVVPASLANPERDALGEIDLGGFTPRTAAPPLLAGVPQSYLANPFPLGLDPIIGKTFGRYTNLGTAVSTDQYLQRPPISDRINVSVQRQLPGKFILDGTYFINFVTRDQYTVNLDLADPRLSYKYKSALSTTVNNPFYLYGTPETFPGTALRNAKTIATSSLLVPYPQYTGITQTGTDLRSARYQSFQIRGQRSFANGFTFLATYAYVWSRAQWFFDAQDEYDNNLSWYNFTVTQSGGAGSPTVTSDPKHRFVTASTWDIPVGRNRRYGAAMSRVADFVVGGWQLSGIYTYTSGPPLIFSASIIAPTSVKQLGNIGAGSYWFDTTGFAAQASFTRRTNPWYYDGLTAPSFKNLDMALSKRFPITERVKASIRLDAFNAMNGMNWAAPNLSVTASDFGKTNTQAAGYYGRQLQYSVRLDF